MGTTTLLDEEGCPIETCNDLDRIKDALMPGYDNIMCNQGRSKSNPYKGVEYLGESKVEELLPIIMVFSVDGVCYGVDKNLIGALYNEHGQQVDKLQHKYFKVWCRIYPIWHDLINK